MFWFSIAIVIISTEIMFTVLYMYRTFHPKGPTELQNENIIQELRDKIQSLEDQVSSLRVAQGMRRRDNG